MSAPADGSIFRTSIAIQSGRLVTRVTTDVDVLNDLVLIRPGHDRGRPSDALFRRGRHVPLESGHDRLDARRDAARGPGDHAIPAYRLSELSAHPGRGRQDQRLSAGTYCGNRCACSSSIARRKAATNSTRSIATTCWRSRIPSSPMAGSILSLSFSACWRWPCCSPMGLSESARAPYSGVLVAFFQYGLRFFRPIQDLSEKYNILQGAMAASERIFKLLDTEPAIRRTAAPSPVPTGATRHRVRPRLVCLQR